MSERGVDDPHAALLARLAVKELNAGGRTMSLADVAPSRGPADSGLPTLSSPLVGASGVVLPRDDEDIDRLPAWQRVVARAVLTRPPLRDHQRLWRSDGECARAMDELLGSWLPTPHVDWSEVSGPEGLARFARYSLAAHRLEAAPAGGFVLDIDAMSPYAVRNGYARYGGVLRLDNNGRFQSLERCGRTIRPADDDFEHEAFAFRSSALFYITVVDHLGFCHLGVSNALLLAMRRTLPVAHPLRCLLRPFVVGTADTNRRTLTSLIPKGSFMHRASALPWDDLQDLFKTMLLGVRFEPLPDRLLRQGTHPTQLGGRVHVHPWAEDGTLWYEGLDGFVADAIEHSPALAGVLSPWYSSATRRFWDELGRHVRDLPELDMPGLAATLTWLLHVVTALHSHVGHVAPYVRNPRFATARVLRGATWAERQNTIHTSTVAAFTTRKMPMLTEAWHEFMPDDGARQAAMRFMQWLMEFQDEVDKRNADREQPFVAFSPRVVACSVSR